MKYDFFKKYSLFSDWWRYVLWKAERDQSENLLVAFEWWNDYTTLQKEVTWSILRIETLLAIYFVVFFIEKKMPCYI